MNVTLERKITLGFATAVFALLLIGASAWFNAARFSAALQRVDHTHDVLDRLDRVTTDILSMQTSARGFVLTGSESVLQPYNQGDAQIDAGLAELDTLTLDNPAQQERLERAGPLLARAREIMRGRIAARRERGLASASDTQAFLEGQAAAEAFRAVVAEMRAHEQELLNERLARVSNSGRNTVVTIVSAGALASIFIAIGGVLLKRDFAKRVQAEKSLHETEERFRRLIASIRDYAILALDPQGRVVTWNEGARDILGYEEKDIIGQHFSRFYPPDALAAHAPERALNEAKIGQHFEGEHWRVRADGSRFWARSALTPAYSADGRLVGYMKVVHDLTPQHDAMQRIANLNADLVKRAEQLEAANRELEAFSYSVSHDLRAPLRHIDGFSNLLANRTNHVLDAESKRFLNIISRAAKQMGTLIDDLLSLSRIGRTPLRLEPVKHSALVAEVIASGHYENAPHPVTWEIGALPDVQADASMLRLVWQNLIGNAVKYSGKNAQPRVAISGATNAKTGEHVFSIRDNGVGFDMQYVDKLFGVFQRLHGPAEFEGTGIGLANVRRIVTRHGGRTWAEGKPGEGATFYFSLPATASPAYPVS